MPTEAELALQRKFELLRKKKVAPGNLPPASCCLVLLPEALHLVSAHNLSYVWALTEQGR